MNHTATTNRSDASATAPPSRFLTIRQAADELVTKDSTIRGLIKSGELPAIQVGGRGQWRIERVKLEDCIGAAYARAAADIKHGDIDEDEAARYQTTWPDPASAGTARPSRSGSAGVLRALLRQLDHGIRRLPAKAPVQHHAKLRLLDGDRALCRVKPAD